MIEVGIISQVKGKKVRVAIGSMVTDFLDVIQLANSFCTHFKPLKVGEQVLVLPIRDELNSGIVLRSIAYSKYDFTSTKDDEEVAIFSDGAIFSYNTSTSTLNILNVKDINLNLKGNINLNVTSINLNAPLINLNGAVNISGSITNDGVDISKNHKHTQTNGNHYGGGAMTSAPNKG